MTRYVLLILLGGCAIGDPLGQHLAAGAHDFCSHSPDHQALIMDEANEALAKYAVKNNEPANVLVPPVCGKQGVNH